MMMRCANSHPSDEVCVDCDPDRRRLPRDIAIERVHELKEQLHAVPGPPPVDDQDEDETIDEEPAE